MKEDMIFALYKDKIVICNTFCEMCRKKYKIDNPMEIYVRINNYQIDRYGRQLAFDNETKEDWQINNKKSNCRINTMKRYYKNRRSKYEDM